MIHEKKKKHMFSHEFCKINMKLDFYFDSQDFKCNQISSTITILPFFSWFFDFSQAKIICCFSFDAQRLRVLYT